MGLITGANRNQFISAELIYSKIKREFKLFNSIGQLDESEFPTYTAEVLQKLGVSVYKESEAVIMVKNHKAAIPRDFGYAYAIYKCPHKEMFCNEKGEHNIANDPIIGNQLVYTGIYNTTARCEINCDFPEAVVGQVRVWWDKELIREYYNPILLTLSPNVKDRCTSHCLNLVHSGCDEITMNNNEFITNFNDGDIYLKYWALPFDDNGIPMVPDIVEIKKAVEWYIKYQVMLNYWMTNSVDNVTNIWQKAEQEYEKAMGEARYISKLPSFSTIVNYIHNKRATTMLTVLSQMDNRGRRRSW